MSRTVIFDPLVPLPLIWALAAVAVVLLAFAIWRGLRGWPLRGLATLALGLALVNPSLQEENRKPLSDIILAVVDDSASQRLSDRPAQTEAALASLSAAVAALENTELRVVRFADGAKDAGSLAMTALAEAIAAEPRARIAGAVIITDGQVHDAGLAPSLPAPLHVLLTGRASDWDRRLVITDAPAFAIIGEEFTLKLRIEDQGAAPALGPEAEITIAVDAEDPVTFSVPVNTDLELPVTLPHGGQNVLHFSLAAVEGELTDRNNAAVVQINGVRDRLRVLLVSGEPHAGERVWRNLLKSDPSVDLVHFTILRPPEKQDGIPVEELSLIAFNRRVLAQAADDMTTFLINQGHRRIGFVIGHPNHMASDQRHFGYRRALDRAGISYEPSIVRPGTFDFESGMTAAEILAVSVSCFNDIGLRSWACS